MTESEINNVAALRKKINWMFGLIIYRIHKMGIYLPSA